jgi:hypothetical protein
MGADGRSTPAYIYTTKPIIDDLLVRGMPTMPAEPELKQEFSWISLSSRS